MVKRIKVMTAVYQNIRLPVAEARLVRGFFADLDRSDSNLHNHTENGRQIYRYPLVQYKVLNRNPVIISAEEGISSIHPHLMEQKELIIGKKAYNDMALTIQLSEMLVGDSKTVKNYRFLSPWLALNQENYERFQAADSEERDQLLSKILAGNILSMCKGFHVTIDHTLQVVHQLQEQPVFYKGQKMVGFIGTFQVNGFIPNLFGLGKGTARGYGTVKLLKENKPEEDE